MVESMVERVARALEDATDANCTYEELARAAIEAMREPTDAMMDAAEDIVVGYDDFALGDGNIYLGIPGYPDKARRVWSQLVDTALNEQVAG